MTVLVDFQIAEYCRDNKLIQPFDPALINPVSIDVRVGDTAKVEIDNGWDDDRINRKTAWADVDLTKYSEQKPYWLNPKAFALVATLETFNMPEFLIGEFRLKSSRAREGYQNALAVYIDPGWSGSVLTMELVNNLSYGSLALYPGLKIGQVFFHRTEFLPDRSYRQTGRYNNDKTVMGSKG